MIEVTLRIRFTQPCLGHKPRRRKPDDLVVLAMPRGQSGRVMFPPAWWRAIVAHGARVKGGSASLASKVAWSLDVAGETQQWIRYVPKADGRKAGHVHHEAFLPGDVIGVDCVLPPGLKPEVFRVWMDAGGKYLGISPYKHGEWGRFEVVAVAVVGVPSREEEPDRVTVE
jgi:hypothetical protein